MLVISSKVGNLWWHLLIALFRSFGLRQILSFPYILSAICQAAEPFSEFFSFFLWCHPLPYYLVYFLFPLDWWIEHFHRTCMTGATAGVRMKWYLPEKCPMQSNCFGFASLRLLMPCLSLCVSLISQCSVIIFSFRQLGSLVLLICLCLQCIVRRTNMVDLNNYDMRMDWDYLNRSKDISLFHQQRSSISLFHQQWSSISLSHQQWSSNKEK